MRRLIVTADDYGISDNATRSILEVADKGTLNRVSILANGLSFEYALREWFKRKEKISLSLHFNLTEGKPVSNPENIRSLVDKNGLFKLSKFSLFLNTVFSVRKKRGLIKDIETELRSQISRINELYPDEIFSIDGHQHIHMIPAVLEVILRLHKEKPFEGIRVPNELMVVHKASLFGYFRHFGLNVMFGLTRSRIKKTNIFHNDYFVGTLSSGSVTLDLLKKSLAEVYRKSHGVVEIGLHPGGVLDDEAQKWTGENDFYLSENREEEKKVLMSEEFAKMAETFKSENFEHPRSRALEVGRFMISGSTAGVINLLLLYLLTSVLGVWYIYSVVIAYLISMAISFVLQKFWTFSHYSLEKTRREIVWYTVNNIFSVIVNVVGVYALVEVVGIWYLYSQVIVLLAIAAWSFFFYRFFVFPQEKSK